MTITRILTLLCWLCLGVPALAETVPAKVDLLPGWRLDDGRHVAGLRISLAPGWKTYWRNPGEAGIPPSFDWSASRNLHAAEVRWPAPHVFSQNGLQSVGYDGGVVLPVVMVPERTGAPIEARLRVDIGVCRDICIPVTLDVTGRLDARNAVPGAALERALADRPMTPDEAGVADIACHLAPGSGPGMRLTAEIRMPQTLGEGETVLFDLADDGIWISGMKSRREGGTLVASADLRVPKGQPLALDRATLGITVIGETGAMEATGCG